MTDQIDYTIEVKGMDRLLEIMERLTLLLQQPKEKIRRPSYKGRQCEMTEIGALWNRLAASPLRRIEAMMVGSVRYKEARRRWDERPLAEYWEKIIDKINNSRFLSGENSQNWRCDFDFMIRPGKHLEIMEGKYDNRGSKIPNAPLIVPDENDIKAIEDKTRIMSEF